MAKTATETTPAVQVVEFDPAMLPRARRGGARKFTDDILTAYRDLIRSGRGAGNGVVYATNKQAVSAASAHRKAILNSGGIDNVTTRVFAGSDGDTQGFMFAILPVVAK